MITRICIFIGLLTLLGAAQPRGAVEDPAQDILDTIQRALSEGDATALRSLMADYTDVRLPDNSGLYSKAQTGYVLRAFFRSYPPQRFVVQHQFSGPNGVFASGRYWHTRGSSALKVSIQLEERGNRTVIRSLMIEGGP